MSKLNRALLPARHRPRTVLMLLLLLPACSCVFHGGHGCGPRSGVHSAPPGAHPACRLPAAIRCAFPGPSPVLRGEPFLWSGATLENTRWFLCACEAGNVIAHSWSLLSLRSGKLFHAVNTISFWVSRPISFIFAYKVWMVDLPVETRFTPIGFALLASILATVLINARWMGECRCVSGLHAPCSAAACVPVRACVQSRCFCRSPSATARRAMPPPPAREPPLWPRPLLLRRPPPTATATRRRRRRSLRRRPRSARRRVCRR